MSEQPPPPPPESPQEPAVEQQQPAEDPLRQSRTGQFWVGLTGFGVVLVLLIIFIAQNTQSVRVSFLSWSGQAPLAVVLLAAVAGAILACAIAGTLRILQLRRRVRRAAKDAKNAG
ncbi:lipopolysaccharide assembly protein LapA domain-containing protein [Nocardioides panacisoli]|uniref:lipopolysaccharide assembly protein LapA domain-containing protein n=1 Tax=Nocardioides panacisoli TaxID=627624 RepID=UPI001C63A3C5|nr:lipopolysaccharide assembly protein LapA domain-containing protein [Nocardioides panacisoli]QYJ02814.1 lipopolysaccharide assembly protein LapA domain-containing protein [Nocardioides panacisoli]